MSGLIESETRAPGLPAPMPPAPGGCQKVLDAVTPLAVTDSALACITSAAKFAPETLRAHVEFLVRWACVDAYYAGKADERKEFGEGYLQGLADIERAIRGGVKP